MNPARRTISPRRRRLAFTSAALIAAARARSVRFLEPDDHNRPCILPTPAQFASVLRFTRCVRSHGVPNIPDPGTRGWKDALASRRLRCSPRSAPARVWCLAPCRQTRTRARRRPQGRSPDELAFASCMRAHGFRSFPDPTSSGQITHEMLAAAGIDLHQPAVCKPPTRASASPTESSPRPTWPSSSPDNDRRRGTERGSAGRSQRGQANRGLRIGRRRLSAGELFSRPLWRRTRYSGPMRDHSMRTVRSPRAAAWPGRSAPYRRSS